MTQASASLCSLSLRQGAEYKEGARSRRRRARRRNESTFGAWLYPLNLFRPNQLKDVVRTGNGLLGSCLVRVVHRRSVGELIRGAREDIVAIEGPCLSRTREPSRHASAGKRSSGRVGSSLCSQARLWLPARQLVGRESTLDGKTGREVPRRGGATPPRVTACSFRAADVNSRGDYSASRFCRRRLRLRARADFNRRFSPGLR